MKNKNDLNLRREKTYLSQSFLSLKILFPWKEQSQRLGMDNCTQPPLVFLSF